MLKIPITGKITNTNQQPLQYVALHIVESNAYTETDNNGFYEFKNVPKGNITIVAYLFGYEQKTEKINTVETSKLNFTLSEKEQHLDEVIVSTTF